MPRPRRPATSGLAAQTRFVLRASTADPNGLGRWQRLGQEMQTAPSLSCTQGPIGVTDSSGFKVAITKQPRRQAGDPSEPHLGRAPLGSQAKRD